MIKWYLFKDILLTGTGITVILSQVLALHPNGLLLGSGLALTVPTVWEHVKALLPSGGDGPSSAPLQRPISPPSSPSQGESDSE